MRKKTSLKQSGTVIRNDSSPLSLSLSLASIYHRLLQVLIWLRRSPFISFLLLAPTTVLLMETPTNGIHMEKA
ncbi:unnamed protein product [Musa acuminata subsp. malaccensis]|uniref:(wild Malaysian banana) hypothetical protein n=1 Tax=Musa acuminata subsp. malaccensis TaxID=214687 RepID=A0A804JJG7_MUSAM|nr:unnamed protein product [Musa acuminata subsp. malaccensis]